MYGPYSHHPPAFPPGPPPFHGDYYDMGPSSFGPQYPPHRHHSGYYPPPLNYPPTFYPPASFPTPYAEGFFNNPPPSHESMVSLSTRASPFSTPDNLSEIRSEVSSQYSVKTGATSASSKSKKESIVSSYDASKVSKTSGSIRKKAWSTTAKPLPINPVEAARLERRRCRNRKASQKAREKLIQRADRGDRIITVLGGVSGSFTSICAEFEKLRIAHVEEQLRMAGVDSKKLTAELKEVLEALKVVRAEIEENNAQKE